jgi:hypothetical protein
MIPIIGRDYKHEYCCLANKNSTLLTFWFWGEGHRWPGSGRRCDVGQPRIRSDLLPFRQNGASVAEDERLSALPHDSGDGPADPVARGRHVELLERHPWPDERKHRHCQGTVGFGTTPNVPL